MSWPGEPTLWRDDGGYVSCSREHHNLSPAYTVVKIARHLVRQGVPVELPEGVTLGSLDSMAWILGGIGQTIPLTPRHAQELAQIARTLLDDHSPSLNPHEVPALRELLRIIEPESEKNCHG